MTHAIAEAQLSQLHIRIRTAVLGGRRPRSLTISYRLTLPAGVRVTIAAQISRSLVPGRYVVGAVALGGAGTGKTRTLRFRVAS